MATELGESTAARAFETVWSTLVDVLGTSATATIFRRAAKSAALHRPELRELRGFEIVREGLDYRVVLPPSWWMPCDPCLEAVRHLVRDELCPLLEELTGQVVIRLLERQPDLQRGGIVAEKGQR